MAEQLAESVLALEISSIAEVCPLPQRCHLFVVFPIDGSSDAGLLFTVSSGLWRRFPGFWLLRFCEFLNFFWSDSDYALPPAAASDFEVLYEWPHSEVFAGASARSAHSS